MLRYTCILETSSYVAGTTQILKNLDSYADETMTLAQFRVKNFWGKGDAYQGINSVYSIMVRTHPAHRLQGRNPDTFRGSARSGPRSGLRSDRPPPS